MLEANSTAAPVPVDEFPNPVIVLGGFSYDPDLDVCFRTLDFMGYPGYRVGDDGSVWSCKKTGGHGHYNHWKKLKFEIGHVGHLRVLLMPGRKWFPVHHLVLLAFVGNRPPGLLGRHFPDPNPSNNCVENLRWGTNAENQQDRVKDGTSNRGTGNSQALLTEAKVLEIRTYLTANGPARANKQAMADKYGVSLCTIHDLWLRFSWKHI